MVPIIVFLIGNWRTLLGAGLAAALLAAVWSWHARGVEAASLAAQVDGLTRTIAVLQQEAALAQQAQDALNARLETAAKERDDAVALAAKAAAATTTQDGQLAPVMRDTLDGLRAIHITPPPPPKKVH